MIRAALLALACAACSSSSASIAQPLVRDDALPTAYAVEVHGP